MTVAIEHEAGFVPYEASTGEPLKLDMQELRLSGTVLPTGARLTVRHMFKTGEERPAEVVYAFMLPRDAALRRFRVVGKGFSVRSELFPVPEAVEKYEEGITKGSLSTLARVYGDGVVNLNVGNTIPGETVAVYLEIMAGVEARNDGFRFRFPFVLAPTYHSQARALEIEPGKGEIELPSDRFDDVILPTWTKDTEGLHQVGFDLAVEMPETVAVIASPSHKMRIRHDGARARVSSMADRDVPNRDLVLDVGADKPITVVAAGVDHEKKGRFAVVLPSTWFGEASEAERNVVFVLDRSGSMSGAPMDQAKRALKACLGALGPGDRFGIVAFDESTESFRNALSVADASSRQEAIEFLNRIDARGGTELAAGIEVAVRMMQSKVALLDLPDAVVERIPCDFVGITDG